MTTKADTYETHKLTSKQQQAVILLASGKTITAAAEAVKVSRQTVSEWLNHNSAFVAELNSYRQELWKAEVERLRSLIPKALDVLERELEGKNALKAASQILKSAGLGYVGGPRGETKAELVEQEWAEARLFRQLTSFG